MRQKQRYAVSVLDVIRTPKGTVTKFVEKQITYAVSPEQAMSNIVYRKQWTEKDMKTKTLRPKIITKEIQNYER